MKELVPDQDQIRQLLDKHIDPETFLTYYWLKQELLTFCRHNKLLTTGSKNELSNRIYKFLKTVAKEGNVNKLGSKVYDSCKSLTLDTEVINYKNDAATSQFFKKHIGKHFHSNSYLRKFAKEKSVEKLTYQDLVNGYNAEELKKHSSYKTKIDPQFQYNLVINCQLGPDMR